MQKGLPRVGKTWMEGTTGAEVAGAMWTGGTEGGLWRSEGIGADYDINKGRHKGKEVNLLL